MPIEITRQFRRDIRQEWRMGRRVKPLPIFLLAAAGFVLAEATRATGSGYWMRIVGFPLVFVGAYFLVLIGSAQLRARAQPFFHTLVMRDDDIEVRDEIRGRQERYPWSDFERVEITPAYFSIRRRGAPRGESYLINRAKLSEAEQAFLGERIIEL